MPMADLSKSKSPSNSFRGKSGKNLRVLVNIHSVIVIDEAVPNRLAKDNPHDDHEKETDSHYGKLIVAGMGHSRRLLAHAVLQ